MKEIKFRVWDNNINKMYQTTSIAITKKNGVLMQFTGLKDKNGKEIYEGDILKVESAAGIEIVEVIFQEKYAAWDFQDIKNKEMCPLTDYYSSLEKTFNVELIGNKFENPELFK